MPKAGVPVDPDTLTWLLDSDPAIRWQVLRDLTDASPDAVTAERDRVAREGWGARLLVEQRPDGQWGDGETHPFWWTNLYSLVWLRDLGVDPDDDRVRRTIALVRDRVDWGEWQDHSPFFDGEVEPCINGRVIALGGYFGVSCEPLVDRLLGEQLEDGGWNCDAERGSVRSSFHTTICVLEGLLSHEKAFGASSAAVASRRRGEEYLLKRGLLRRRSTGQEIDPAWSRLAFPPLWHYDVLRALDYLRAAGVAPDERAADAVERVAAKRTADGRWLLEVRHEDTLHPEMGGSVGEPNRWVTLRALRGLAWASG